MHATVRRYEGVDRARSEEITRQVEESLLPRLRELPGFAGYYLIDAGEGVLTSVSLFNSSDQAHESTQVAARWIREQDLTSALPNSPEVTAGNVTSYASDNAAVGNGVGALA